MFFEWFRYIIKRLTAHPSRNYYFQILGQPVLSHPISTLLSRAYIVLVQCTYVWDYYELQLCVSYSVHRRMDSSGKNNFEQFFFALDSFSSDGSCLLNDSGCYNHFVSSIYYSIFRIDYSISCIYRLFSSKI